MTDQKVDTRAFRQALGKFATGVTVVSTVENAFAHGMTANSFTSVSLDPPLILVSIDNTARIKNKLENSGVLGLSILNAEQRDVSQNFAGKPQDSVSDPFEWVDGVPLIKGALARLRCRITEIVPAGDHSLFIARVDAFEQSDAEPLMFFSGNYAERASA